MAPPSDQGDPLALLSPAARCILAELTRRTVAAATPDTPNPWITVQIIRLANACQVAYYTTAHAVADLRGADLHGADLRGAWLAGAHLAGANLRESWLIDGCLDEVSTGDLADTHLTGSIWSLRP